MKQHFTAGAVAAVIASGVAGGVAHYSPPQVIHVTHEMHASKHAWPDLTDPEKAAIGAAVQAMAPVKFDIVCKDAGCNDLAMDLDDAFERGAAISVLDGTSSILGYGIWIEVEGAELDKAATVSAAVKAATGGRLDIPIAPGSSAPGYVKIVIGKYRAK